MSQIPFPIIFFSVFIILIVLLNYLQSKNSLKYHQKIKDCLKQNSIKFDLVILPKTETYQIGRKINEGIRMTKCEILVTTDAVIILGKTIFNIHSKPLIFTRNLAYSTLFPYAKVVMPKKINLDSFSNSIYFEFGEASFLDYCFMIRMYNVEHEIKNKIELALNKKQSTNC